MREHIVTFSMLACNGERWLTYKNAAFLLSLTHIIRHPNSSYLTTKLYGTSTCGCNNNTIFSERTIFTFPTGVVCRAATLAWQWRIFDDSYQSANMAALLNCQLWGGGGALAQCMVRAYDWQSSGSRFESCWGRLETFAISFTPLCQCFFRKRQSLLSGVFYLVSMPGEVKYPISLQWRCVTVVDATIISLHLQ